MIEPLWKVEREYIMEALIYFGGNRTHTARALDISIRTLRNKIRQYQAQGHWIPEWDGKIQYGTYSKAQDERSPAFKNFERPEEL